MRNAGKVSRIRHQNELNAQSPVGSLVAKSLDHGDAC